MGAYHQASAQQLSSKGFQQQHISQAANTSYMRNNMTGTRQQATAGGLGGGTQMAMGAGAATQSQLKKTGGATAGGMVQNK